MHAKAECFSYFRLDNLSTAFFKK